MSDLDEQTLAELKEAFNVDDKEPEQQLEFAVEVNHRISTLSDQHYFLEQSMQDSDVQISTEDNQMLSVVNRHRDMNFNDPAALKRVGVLCWLNYLESLEERLNGCSDLNESFSSPSIKPLTNRPDIVTARKYRVPYLFRDTLEDAKNTNEGLREVISQQQRAVASLHELFRPERIESALQPIRDLIEMLHQFDMSSESNISNGWLNVIRSMSISRYGKDETSENIGNNIAYMLEDLLGMPTKMTVNLDDIPTIEKILFGEDLQYETTAHPHNSTNHRIHWTAPLFDNRYLTISTPKLECLNPLEQFSESYSYWRTSIHIEAIDDRGDGCCEPISSKQEEEEVYEFERSTLNQLESTMLELEEMVTTTGTSLGRTYNLTKELILSLIKHTTAVLTNPILKDKIGFVEFRAITFVVEYAINNILHPIHRGVNYVLDEVIYHNQKWLRSLFKTTN